MRQRSRLAWRLDGYGIVLVPTNTVLPVISGTDTVGDVLSTTNGTWTKSPTGYSYQWNRNGSPISGATASTYTLVLADDSQFITVAVTATNTHGPSSPAVSSAVGPIFGVPVNTGLPVIVEGVPVNTALPGITGVPSQGQTLGVSNGSWTNSPTSYSYQWLRNGSSIAGATSATYTLVSADVGTMVACAVTAINAIGDSTPADSAAVGPILPPVPVNSVAPAITGTDIVGSVLTCSDGTWTNSPTSYAFQWFSAGVAVGGATNSTYTLQSSDLGNDITCQVTASNAGGAGTPATSNSVGPIAGVPVNSVAPVVSGSTTQGSTLSTTNGTWTNSPTGYSYQWFNSSTGAISGATSSTYVTQVSDIGDDIDCVVTASNSAGNGTPAASNSVGPITSASSTPSLNFSVNTNSMYIPVLVF